MLRFPVLACALTSTLVALAACSTEPATPQAAVESRLEVQTTGTPGFDACPLNDSWIQIGSYRGPGKSETELIVDGADQGGVPVTVDCSVVDNGGTFAVEVKGEVAGVQGGVIQISGNLSPSGVQENVSAVFRRGEYGQFSASNCTVSYYDTNEDESQPSFRGVASGRVWGFLKCPEVTNVERNTACRASVQFRFENCAQE